MDHWPKTSEERIAAFRRIVDGKTYAKIDGIMIDMTTAHVVVTVYNALNKANQQKFAEHKSLYMANIAFKLVSK